jgi:hypothetical protein
MIYNAQLYFLYIIFHIQDIKLCVHLTHDIYAFGDEITNLSTLSFFSFEAARARPVTDSI